MREGYAQGVREQEGYSRGWFRTAIESSAMVRHKKSALRPTHAGSAVVPTLARHGTYRQCIYHAAFGEQGVPFCQHQIMITAV